MPSLQHAVTVIAWLCEYMVASAFNQPRFRVTVSVSEFRQLRLPLHVSSYTKTHAKYFNMKKILTIKPWLLFLILMFFAIPSLIAYFINFSKINTDIIKINAVLRILGISIYYLWILTLGISLYKKIQSGKKIGIVLFVLSVIVVAGQYITMNISTFSDTGLNSAISGFIMIFVFPALFYVYYFIAKLFKSAELGKTVSFSESIVEAFLFFIYPIGIWILQPKIIKIFNK